MKRILAIFTLSMLALVAFICGGFWIWFEGNHGAGALFIFAGAARLAAFYISTVYGFPKKAATVLSRN